MPDETMRAEFERWYEHDFMGGLDSAGEFDAERNCYVVFQVHMAWKGWQASRASAAPGGEPVVVTLPERISELVERHGSLHAAARVLRTNVGYLSRLASGEKTNPGDLLQFRMGVAKVTTYVRTRAAISESEGSSNG